MGTKTLINYPNYTEKIIDAVGAMMANKIPASQEEWVTLIFCSAAADYETKLEDLVDEMEYIFKELVSDCPLTTEVVRKITETVVKHREWVR